MCSGQCSSVQSGALSGPHPIRLWAWRLKACRSAHRDLYPNLNVPLRLRLPEQTSQRKQQSTGACPNRCTPKPSQELVRSLGAGVMGLVPEKQLKKVLTLETKIEYHGGRFQKRQGLLPGRVFVFADPSER